MNELNRRLQILLINEWPSREDEDREAEAAGLHVTRLRRCILTDGRKVLNMVKTRYPITDTSFCVGTVVQIVSGFTASSGGYLIPVIEEWRRSPSLLELSSLNAHQATALLRAGACGSGASRSALGSWAAGAQCVQRERRFVKRERYCGGCE